MAILEVKSLTHRFTSGTLGLDNVNFSLDQGSFNILAGRNGSGKTVLMKHLNGLLQATSGEVFIDGRSVASNGTWARTRVGLIFQDPDSCMVGQTIQEDTAFGLENQGIPRKEIDEHVQSILTRLGLWEKKDFPPRLLSGGEKKRVTLAGVLVMAPDILILDEPFVGLDYPGVRDILSLLVELHRGGQTILVITHDLEKILAHGDNLLLMDNGTIVKSGAPADLIDVIEDLGIRRPPERLIQEMTWLKSYSE